MFHVRSHAATAGLFVLAMSSIAAAAPVDLSSWSALTLDFPGGQSGANWVLEPGNTAVEQVVNADPSFYLNNLNQTSYSIDGSWQVRGSGGDDDYIGFTFGHQNSSNFYLFDWKQGTQSYEGANANEGMSIKRFQGATGNGLTDLSLGELWNNVAPTFGDMAVLATNHSTAAGWVDNTLYEFHLDFNLTPGDIHITVKNGVTTLWDVTINDTTFSAGEFGFYNYSQERVRYAGFEQTGGVVFPDGVFIPEPASAALLGLGLIGIMCSRRHRRPSL